jgi:hypothetical protein
LYGSNMLLVFPFHGSIDVSELILVLLTRPERAITHSYQSAERR